MSKEKNKQTVQAFYEAGNRGDMETCNALISDDVVWTNVGTTSFSGTFRGKPELQEKLLGPLFARLKSGIHMNVQKLIAEGDYVVAHSTGTAETSDGEPYNNTYCWIIRVKDGKFAEVTEFADTQLIATILA